jgi:AhpD family alkylhydroperoxidase
MQRRFDYQKASPEALKQMLDLTNFVNGCELEESLLRLVFVRASLMNGCAYCIDMHTKEARAVGESEQRLYVLGAWRETPFYSDRERAAMRWTEALTFVSDDHVPDCVYEIARAYFSEQELANLSLAIITINAWNRLMIAFREPPGSCQPKQKPIRGYSVLGSKFHICPTSGMKPSRLGIVSVPVLLLRESKYSILPRRTCSSSAPRS